MADDGLLMNFAVEDSGISLKPVFKGGKWRDRLQAKKSQVRRSQPKRSAVEATQQVPENVGVNSNYDDEDVSSYGPPAKRVKSSHDGNTKSRNVPQKEVISSLFSSNPVATRPAGEKERLDDSTAQPSNAPLVDGIDTFTSIGISNNLAAHLITKMGLKAPTAIQKTAVSQLLQEDTDAFLQAQTGSGKTLAYLVPIVQRIMEMSRLKQASGQQTQLHRDSGLFAIIMAPTRELCKQIYVVLENLLHSANWIVGGIVIGGEKKKSEKARLRKGVNILVATPGRLADHLNNTKSLDVSNVRWLVLDEGDRLMELGFEEEIKGIVTKLEERSQSASVRMPGLPSRRTTVLCSATMKMDVQRLGEISLKDAVHIKVDGEETAATGEEEQFTAPAQLKQSYLIVPPKQRLVVLAALLKRTFARKGAVSKAIVFLSCADSVDFHFTLFGRAITTEGETNGTVERAKPEATTPQSPKPSKSSKDAPTSVTVSPAPILTSSRNPGLTLHKLHGSLPQPVRTATLNSFSRTTNPSILLCTDVASRGLDLPDIDLVIEYDPPFAFADHLHRIGRTARAGRDGRASIFLMPGTEEGYIDELKKAGQRPKTESADEVLRKGFAVEGEAGTSSRGWEDRATDWQLDAERWIIEDVKAGEMARKAYISHVRAYATHVVPERHMFDVKSLHLGHLAKAFALRDRPGGMGRDGKSGSSKSSSGRKIVRGTGESGAKQSRGGADDGGDRVIDHHEAAKRMRKAMEAQTKGASEFNIG
jgi:ATP-dependent RNA helicase DDX31/DBP7